MSEERVSVGIVQRGIAADGNSIEPKIGDWSRENIGQRSVNVAVGEDLAGDRLLARKMGQGHVIDDGWLKRQIGVSKIEMTGVGRGYCHVSQRSIDRRAK